MRRALKVAAALALIGGAGLMSGLAPLRTSDTSFSLPAPGSVGTSKVRVNGRDVTFTVMVTRSYMGTIFEGQESALGPVNVYVNVSGDDSGNAALVRELKASIRMGGQRWTTRLQQQPSLALHPIRNIGWSASITGMNWQPGARLSVKLDGKSGRKSFSTSNMNARVIAVGPTM